MCSRTVQLQSPSSVSPVSETEMQHRPGKCDCWLGGERLEISLVGVRTESREDILWENALLETQKEDNQDTEEEEEERERARK